MSNTTLPSRRSRSESTRLEWGWLVLGALLIVVGLLFEVLFEPQKQQLEQQHQEVAVFIARLGIGLLVEFGIALVIAYFVAATVERVMRRRAEKEHEERLDSLMRHHDQSLEIIKQNIFKYLLQTVIPAGVLQEVRLAVFDARFVRRNMDLHYVFRRLDAHPATGHAAGQPLLMTATVTYDLVNIASEKEKLTVHHYFEDLVRVDGYRGRLTAFEITGCETEIRLTADELRDEDGPVDRSGYRTQGGVQYRITSAGVRQGVEVPGVAVWRDKPARVRYTYEMVRRYCDSETYFVTQPVEDGIHITAALDASIGQAIHFWPDTAHRLGELDVQVQGEMLSRWHIKAPLLPGQGVVLFWCAREGGQEGAGRGRPGEGATEA